MYRRLTDTVRSGLMFGIPSSPPSTYLTLLLRNAGQVKAVYIHSPSLNSCFRFNTFNTNLLTIPSQALGIVTMFFITLVSELVGERSIVSMMEDLWTLPFLVAIYALPSSPNPWLFFVRVPCHPCECILIHSQGLLTGLLSYPYVFLHLSCHTLAGRPGLSYTHPIQVGGLTPGSTVTDIYS